MIGRSKISGRLAAGFADGSRFGRHFFLSSFDNLRGFLFNDNRLLGDAYYVAQAELAIPLDIFIRFAFFQNITGILGADFGGVVNSGTARRSPELTRCLNAAVTEAWANRSMDWVVGANLGLGPFELTRAVRAGDRRWRDYPGGGFERESDLGAEYISALCVLDYIYMY